MSERADINAINSQVIAEFRANEGRILTGRFAGSRLLLLTTKGAKSGATRVNPMMYVEDAGRWIVFASKRGAPTNPDWYHNLVAHPEVTVELGGHTFAARARVTVGEERRRVWDFCVALHPFLAELQASTRRRIPVISLERL
jgi:deazaflavin-dependent oxidoreductase (nitroreductase family)